MVLVKVSVASRCYGHTIEYINIKQDEEILMRFLFSLTDVEMILENVVVILV